MPFEFVDGVVEFLAGAPGGQQVQPLEQFGGRPALVAVEAEHERRRRSRLADALRHQDQLVAEEFVGDVAEVQRNLAVVALHQIELALVAAIQPAHELRGVAHGRAQ